MADMTAETRNCQNCKTAFTIEPEDFDFYQAMRVPPPVKCPQCRMVQRMGWYGLRFLYKRKCDASGDQVITFYHPEAPHKIYRQDIWWSDKWDPKEYGRDFDLSRPFFEQWAELFRAVPLPALNTSYTTMVDSDYCNAVANLKNCYLVFDADSSENSAYALGLNDSKETYDATHVHFLELCQDVLMVDRGSRVFSSQFCEESYNIWFSRDLVGCTNCIGCINLRNKKNYIFNRPVTPEGFNQFVKEQDLGSHQKRAAFQKRAEEFFLTQPHKAFHGRRNVDSNGDYLFDCKNVRDSFLVYSGENMRYCQMAEVAKNANAYDYTAFGLNSEWMYESAWCGISVSNLKFCLWNYSAHDLEYSFGCHGSSDLFGCVGVRNGQYCILNQQYSKEDYLAAKEKIIEHMKGTGEYGSFFPAKYSPWAYNETRGRELAPLTKDEAIAHGFSWREDDPGQYRDATMEIPDHINDVPDDILQAILKCGDCGRNYQLIRPELEFYRHFSIPVPRRCPFCRDRARINMLNPIAIYERNCMKCRKAIKTSYAPDRSEIVYCEQCYNAEVA